MPYFKDTAGGLHFLDDAALASKYLPSGYVQITDAAATLIQNPDPTTAQLHAALVASAKTALDTTDMVCLRCYKAGMAFPAPWQTYTASIRAIVNGSDTTSNTLPTQPAYPAGT